MFNNSNNKITTQTEKHGNNLTEVEKYTNVSNMPFVLNTRGVNVTVAPGHPVYVYREKETGKIHDGISIRNFYDQDGRLSEEIETIYCNDPFLKKFVKSKILKEHTTPGRSRRIVCINGEDYVEVASPIQTRTIEEAVNMGLVKPRKKDNSIKHVSPTPSADTLLR